MSFQVYLCTGYTDILTVYHSLININQIQYVHYILHLNRKKIYRYQQLSVGKVPGQDGTTWTKLLATEI